jgi:hypothetical protein
MTVGARQASSMLWCPHYFAVPLHAGLILTTVLSVLRRAPTENR